MLALLLQGMCPVCVGMGLLWIIVIVAAIAVVWLLLAVADVGVAMGSGGTDVALETADIALMTDDLTRLGTTIRFARRAERIIRANIASALLTKAVFVLLAVLGLATLWTAVLADMGASLLVVLNGLRALRD